MGHALQTRVVAIIQAPFPFSFFVNYGEVGARCYFLQMMIAVQLLPIPNHGYFSHASFSYGDDDSSSAPWSKRHIIDKREKKRSGKSVPGPRKRTLCLERIPPRKELLAQEANFQNSV